MGGERERLFEVCEDVLCRDHRCLEEQQLPHKVGGLSCVLALALALAVKRYTFACRFSLEPVGLPGKLTQILDQDLHAPLPRFWLLTTDPPAFRIRRGVAIAHTWARHAPVTLTDRMKH